MVVHSPLAFPACSLCHGRSGNWSAACCYPPDAISRLVFALACCLQVPQAVRQSRGAGPPSSRPQARAGHVSRGLCRGWVGCASHAHRWLLQLQTGHLGLRPAASGWIQPSPGGKSKPSLSAAIPRRLPSLDSGFSRQLFADWAEEPRNAIIFVTRAEEGTLAEQVQQLGAAQQAQQAEAPTIRMLRSHRVPLEGEELEAHLAQQAEQAEQAAQQVQQQAAAEGQGPQAMQVDGGPEAAAAAAVAAADGSGPLSPRASAVPRVNSLAIGHLKSFRGSVSGPGSPTALRGEVVGPDGMPVHEFQEAATTAQCLVEGFEVPQVRSIKVVIMMCCRVRPARWFPVRTPGGRGITGCLCVASRIRACSPPHQTMLQGAARPMFPFEDAWEHVAHDEYGASLDYADFDPAEATGEPVWRRCWPLCRSCATAWALSLQSRGGAYVCESLSEQSTSGPVLDHVCLRRLQGV